MRTLLATIAVLPALAGPAHAASVALETSCEKYDGCTHTVRYAAGRGEANALEVTRPEPYTLRVRDSGVATVRPGVGCTAEDAVTVVCSGGAGYEYSPDRIVLSARLHDGDDRAVVADGFVAGGAGDDVITAGGGGQLRGGPGRDVLTGSAATDHFSDGDGRRPAADRYVGGGGGDGVDYEGRRAAIRIDLPGGRAGEDMLDAVEHASGGSGDDRLIGTAGANDLTGGPGDDVIEGRAGDDQIRPGSGADVVRAGAGADTITLPDFMPKGTGDRIACGSGRDLVDSTGESDLLLPGCERFAFNDSLALDNFPHHFPAGSGATVVRMQECCDWGARTSATLRARGARIARVGWGRRSTIVLRLDPAGWAMLRRAGRLRVQVTLRSDASPVERRGVRLELRLRR